MLERIDREAQATRWAVAPLSLALACEWIESGLAEQRLAWQIDEMQQRWRLAARVLGARMPQGRAVAPHLWLDVEPPVAEALRLRRHTGASDLMQGHVLLQNRILLDGEFQKDM